MYRLYGYKGWGSLAPQLVLDELELEYESRWPDARERQSAEYRRLNPMGLVPTLILPDGRAVFESSAIVTYLTDAHDGESRLAPRPGRPDHAIYLAWLTYMNAEIYATINAAEFVEDQGPAYLQDARELQALSGAIREKALQLFGIVEARLAESGGFLLGPSLGAADLYLMMLTLWAKPSPQALLARAPAIARVVAAVKARPQLRQTLLQHELL